MAGQGLSWEQARRMRRFGLALLIAIALVAQGIAGHIWRVQSWSAGAGLVNLSLDEPCKGTPNESGPAKQRGNATSACCVLCRAADADNSAYRPFPEALATLLWHLASTDSAIWPAFVARNTRPPGCGCTWSAQAPPHLRSL